MASKRVNGRFVKEEAQQINEAVAKITPETIQASIAKTQNDAVKTLAGVQEQAVNALNELDTVKKAVEVQRQEAERIHGVAAIALEREEAEQQLEDRKNELDRELAAFQQNIEDQKAQSTRALAESLRQTQEKNFRDQQQWTYEFETKKRTEQTTWDEAKRRRDLDEQIRLEGFNRNIAEREAAMKAQEQELVDLRAKVAGFPATLDAAVKKEVAITTNSLTRDNQHAIEILNSKHAADKQVSDNTIASLRTESANKDRIIEQLQTRLNAAEEKVSTIATKALETAANVKSQADANTAAAIAGSGQKRV